MRIVHKPWVWRNPGQEITLEQAVVESLLVNNEEGVGENAYDTARATAWAFGELIAMLHAKGILLPEDVQCFLNSSLEMENENAK